MPDGSPNYLTQNADGSVSALFSGGVKIFAGTTTTPPDTRKVTWVRESSGALVAQIKAYDDQSGGNLYTSWDLDDPDSLRAAGFFQESLSTNGPMRMGVYAEDGLGNLQSKLIINSVGTSDWLQLLTQAKKKIAFGNQALSWPGGSSVSNQVAINHGLGVQPDVAIAFMNDQTGTGPCTVRGYSKSAVSFTIDAYTSGFAPGAGNNGAVAWLAIG